MNDVTRVEIVVLSQCGKAKSTRRSVVMPKEKMIVDVLVGQIMTYRIEVEAENLAEAEKYVSDPEFCCDPRDEGTELLVIWEQFVRDVSFDDGSPDDDLPLLQSIEE